MSELEMISPQEVQKRRRQVVEETSNPQPYQNSEPIKEGFKINYTSNGRFNTPATLYWKDFGIKDITTISLSDENDFLSNVVFCMNSMQDTPSFDCKNFLPEEFLETLILHKIYYQGSIHKHVWMCDCQKGLEDEDQQVCTTEIDLKELKFSTIGDAEEKLKKNRLEIFKQLSNEQFLSYLKDKYGNIPDNISPEIETQNIKIKEPFRLSFNGNVYTVRYNRIGDIIEAQKIAQRKYSSELKRVKQEKMANVPIAEQKRIKQENSKSIKKRIAADIASYSRALCLLTKNGEELTTDQKYNEWTKNSKNFMYDLNDYVELTSFGLNHEKELTCEFCGEQFRRSLQHEFSFIHFLPLNPDSDNEQRRHRGNPVCVVI